MSDLWVQNSANGAFASYEVDFNNTQRSQNTPVKTSTLSYRIRLACGVVCLLSGIAILIYCAIDTAKGSKACDAIRMELAQPFILHVYQFLLTHDVMYASKYTPAATESAFASFLVQVDNYKNDIALKKHISVFSRAHKTLLAVAPTSSVKDTDGDRWKDVQVQLAAYKKPFYESRRILGMDPTLPLKDGVTCARQYLALSLIRMHNLLEHEMERGVLNRLTLSSALQGVVERFTEEVQLYFESFERWLHFIFEVRKLLVHIPTEIKKGDAAWSAPLASLLSNLNLVLYAVAEELSVCTSALGTSVKSVNGNALVFHVRVGAAAVFRSVMGRSDVNVDDLFAVQQDVATIFTVMNSNGADHTSDAQDVFMSMLFSYLSSHEPGSQVDFSDIVRSADLHMFLNRVDALK